MSQHNTQFVMDLVGPGEEPVDLWRILTSHGMSELPPMALMEGERALEVTLPLPGMRPRTVQISAAKDGLAQVLILGRQPGARVIGAVEAQVRHILRLEEDLSGFYGLASKDADLAWVTRGAGRMIRGATVFEDVIKTICTTNCAWSATQRMVAALVKHLGQPAADAPPASPRGRAFPTAAAMASANEAFYIDVVRAGYRGRYLLEIATAASAGDLNLEALGQATAEDLPDDELEMQLLELPGVGPYAAAHIMLMLGRYSRLIFDSWTRPKYASLAGRTSVKDSAIEKRFRRYGRFAGLAFWLFLTRDWVEDPG